MNSFYLSLNSDGSKNVYPHNHGGDFTIDLHRTLDLHGRWEVALVEMSYFGQSFGNLLEPYNIVQLYSNRKKAYPTTFMLDFYQSNEISMTFWRFTESTGHWRSTGEVKFPRRHYNWRDFKKTIAQFKNETPNHNEHGMHQVSFAIKEGEQQTLLVITSVIHRTRMKIEFSPKMRKLLSIQEENVIIGISSENLKTTINIIKPNNITDTTQFLFTPKTPGDLWLVFNGTRIELPKLYWTEKMFQRAINLLLKENNCKCDIEFANSDEMMVSFSGAEPPIILFSNLISTTLSGINKGRREYIKRKSVSYDFKINQIEDVENDYEMTFKLPFNYYPSAKTLIESLNTSCKEHIQKLIIQQASDQEIEGQEIFTLHERRRDICSFMPVEHFRIQLSSYLLNVLSLLNTDENNIGTNPITLVSANRPFLYVCSDVVLPHLINSDEYSLLRIINNNASENEKVMLSFPTLHYYPVCRRYISKIRSYIIDHFSTDSLPFKHTVAYLLHFRPCHSI
jgi:hypothetical protein